VNDTAKGGDIDLFVECADATESPVAKTIQLNGALQQQLGIQKIDIIFHAPYYDWKPIHTAAKTQGLLL
jgi:hypothetical protein